MTSGESPGNDGTIFSIGANGTGFANVFSFDGDDGAFPNTKLVLGGSTLYGMVAGDGVSGDGNMFGVGTNGTNFRKVLLFTGTNGNVPLNLTLSGSTLYGVTEWGGTSGLGNIFSIGTDGSNFQNLFSFSGSNGEVPCSLTLVGGTLFGMTVDGGTSGDGNIFCINTNGTGFKSLLSFNGPNGEMPQGGLTLRGSTLYGTTEIGGANNEGTVFAFNDPSIIPPKITLSSASSATMITGGTAAPGVMVSNSSGSSYNLNYTVTAAVLSGSAALGAISSGTGSLAPGGSQSCTVSASSTSLGVTTISFTGSDPNASNSPQVATATLTVLDHAAAAFAGGGGTLNLNFGTLQVGSRTKDLQYQVENLPAAYRAGLALESVMALSDPDGVFSTDATPFANLAPGTASNQFDLFLNTSQLGNFSGSYQFNLSDEQDLSGWAGGQTLTLNVTAEVVPEPSTLTLLAAGAAVMLGCALRRGRRNRARIELQEL